MSERACALGEVYFVRVSDGMNVCAVNLYIYLGRCNVFVWVG